MCKQRMCAVFMSKIAPTLLILPRQNTERGECKHDYLLSHSCIIICHEREPCPFNRYVYFFFFTLSIITRTQLDMRVGGQAVNRDGW